MNIPNRSVSLILPTSEQTRAAYIDSLRKQM